MTKQPIPSAIKQYTFTKEILDDHITNSTNLRKQLRLYKVINSEGNIAGQFFYYPKKQFIAIDGNEIEVKVIEKFFKKTQYPLIDTKSNGQIGEIKYFGGPISYFWQDVPSLPNGTITLDDIVFNFRRIPAAVRSIPFKQDTWGHFKFRLYAIKGDKYANYTLKMDVPAWRTIGFNYIPFTGTIETNFENITAIVAAFYLMEYEFELQDET
jgi:hypothetical protein